MRPRLRLVRGLWPRSRTRTIGRRLRSPQAELLVALAAAVGGAWLIALWAVGLVIIVFAMLVAADAVLRDSGKSEKPVEQTRHDEIMEQWRKAR